MDDINIAMLIDADNVSSKYIPGILSELSKFGKITVRRMYGDWSQDRGRARLQPRFIASCRHGKAPGAVLKRL